MLATFVTSSAFRLVIPVLLRHPLVYALVVTVQSTQESPLACISDITPLDEGASRAVAALLIVLNRRFQRSFRQLQQRLLRWTKPTSSSLSVGTLNDVARTRADLLADGEFTYRDSNKNRRMDPFEDPRRPIEERVEDLFSSGRRLCDGNEGLDLIESST